MKILNSLASGALRSLKSWKGVTIIWFLSLLLVSLFVTPMKGILKAGFGSSMITEKLLGGLDIEVFADLGQYLSSLASYFFSGFFLVVLLGILMNSFLAGGLFNSLKGSSGKFSTSDFFRSAARYFWYFLGLYLMIMIILLFTGLLVVALPAGLIVHLNIGAGRTALIVGIITGSLLLLTEVMLLLVADYARAWLVSAEKPAFFRAFGFGFSATFGSFGSSFPMMLILMVIQVLFGWLALIIISSWVPVTGGGVFLLFLVSQLLFLIKILLKTWRYGSVTSMMELNSPSTT